MQNPAYWAIRERVRNASFRIAKQRYTASAGTTSLRRGLVITWQLIAATSKTALAAVATAATLQYLDTQAHLPAWIKTPESYDVYLAAVAGITGVLLALSFAAISTLASALFVRLPSNLRSLLLDDEVTKFSIHALAFMTVLCTTALGLRNVGLPPSRLTTIALLLALPFTIVSMTLVAQRVLNLFDPSILAGSPLRELLRSAVAAETSRHRSTDPSFQEHHRKRASLALDTLATMVAFAQQEEQLRGESLLRLTSDILQSIPLYLNTKRKIPTASRWFAQKPRYPEWYRAGSTQIDMATMTESSLAPELESDHHWVERRLLDLTALAYDTMLDDPTSGRPHRFLLQANRTLQTLGAEWDLALAREYTDRLMAATIGRLAEPGAATDADRMARETIADALSGLPTASFLGFAISAAELEIRQVDARLRDMDWESDSGITDLRPRLRLHRLLEKMRATTLFERGAEGHAVTPGHIHASQALHELGSEVQSGLAFIIEWFTDSAPKVARELTPIGSRLGAIACINGLGFRWKIDRHLDHLRPIPETIAQIMAGDQPARWPWEDWQAALEQTRTTLQLALAEMLPSLAASPRQSDSPDLLGEVVHRLGEACFDALANGRCETFTELFPQYFSGVQLVVNQLQEQRLTVQELAVRIQDAVLDLIHLSGYARVWSSLHRDRRYWAACRPLWDAYLRASDAPRRCEAIALMIENASLRITSRSAYRMRWQMALARTLRELPQDRRRIPGTIVPDTFPRHPSLLIRFLGRNEAHQVQSGATVFRDLYLRRKRVCAGVTFRRDSIVSAVRRFARLRYA